MVVPVLLVVAVLIVPWHQASLWDRMSVCPTSVDTLVQIHLTYFGGGYETQAHSTSKRLSFCFRDHISEFIITTFHLLCLSIHSNRK